MRNATVILNILILFCLWSLGIISLLPALNLFYQYVGSSPDFPLPILTEIVFRFRFHSFSIPVLWLLISLYFILTKKNDAEFIQIHTSITVLIGLVILIVFITAAVLPFVKFYGVV